MATDKIVFCVARGRREFAEMALGLARSLRLVNDRTPRVIMTDIAGYEWHRYYDEVIPPPTGRSALDKLLATEVTDAKKILALDVDMLAFRPLDGIFNHCAGQPLAVQGFWDDSGHFHGKSAQEIAKIYGFERAFPRFNGGLVYYEAGAEWTELLDLMRRSEQDYAGLGFETFREGHASEEVCLLHAMIKLDRINLIEPEHQFQHTFLDLAGRLQVDIERNLCRGICHGRQGPELVQPYIFHAARYKHFLLYWNQLRKLRQMEESARGLRRGHLPFLARLRRSVERRWVKSVRNYR